MTVKQLDNLQVPQTPVCHTAKLLSLILAVLFMVSTLILIRVPESVKGYMYGVFREIARAQMLLRTHGWQHVEDEYLIIRYIGDHEGSELVQETTQLVFQRICDDFNFSPKQKVPIVVYNSREELNASFGWPASENAMGVYWGGVIRVLAPQAWINESDPAAVRHVFQQAGPMAHEMTHLVLDYVARGNYPRWFTEGLAQYEEYKITGFMFEQQTGIWDQGLYPLKVMDRNFDSLPNQSLAYRQSLSAVEYIVAVYGEDGLHRIIKNLSKGLNFHDSMIQALGTAPEQFESQWHVWLSRELHQPLYIKREDQA
ncbi:peptidase MA family metallohydrolase [Desulfoscipio gibsoniae]|uniref:Peptidase MA-like domain-containing protein n=1 Tax=Desulfoscipio gibsoniae DSM 7213 TaxID=767817 RepID=R4KTI0_9FIRM|nr:peptidase MA family metallohydrolase [Desulfoscipio gibsoniae]AGL03910.1 hypothetical protein Desgi_4684 [Desulfoscipio gibsoniae DSM 7213]